MPLRHSRAGRSIVKRPARIAARRAGRVAMSMAFAASRPRIGAGGFLPDARDAIAALDDCGRRGHRWRRGGARARQFGIPPYQMRHFPTR
ncbi:MAG: hypothetical protein P0Y64_10060 [Candidatus Sphingomonas colombiensis]|nr:hypothetical protein [Sphingomonas sp.]WEK41759.1 MAG: hypothetical protein P0Y64_10060 [Sphingomonas sp.]